MPALYGFDAYEQCMENYDFIHEFSSKEKQHFRHDKLQRGVCMKKCLGLVDSLGDEADNYITKKFPFNSKLNFEFIDYPAAREDRLRFNPDVNVCINKQLMDNYNLSGFSSIEYCLRREKHIQLGRRNRSIGTLRLFTFNCYFDSDWVDFSVAGVITIWLLLVCLSSVFDAGRGKASLNTRHYTTPFKSSSEYEK